jgi:hypothetical protein
MYRSMTENENHDKLKRRHKHTSTVRKGVRRQFFKSKEFET